MHLLDTQYRCHPRISSFPAKYFYNGRLLDGANVLSPAYTTPFHVHLAFSPFAFYDLQSEESRGRKRRPSIRTASGFESNNTITGVKRKREETNDEFLAEAISSRSWCNIPEAILAVHLCSQLQVWKVGSGSYCMPSLLSATYHLDRLSKSLFLGESWSDNALRTAEARVGA